jgi:transcriptional regulator with GAF, ATPase, and Fis domain
VLLSESDTINTDNLPMEITTKPITLGKIDFELPEDGISFEEFEHELILKAMAKSNGVLGKAAALLGMSYRTLQYRLNKFEIAKEDFTAPKGASAKPKWITKEPS